MHRYRNHSHHDLPQRTIPGHIIEIVDATIEALCASATVLITFAVTHHIEDHPHVEIPQPIPEIAADPDHALHTNQVTGLCVNLHPVLTEPQ